MHLARLRHQNTVLFYNLPNSLLMLPELKGSSQSSKTYFIKGMTLQQYMSNLEFASSTYQSQESSKQQNFIQNTLLAHSRPQPSANFKDLIQEVDEESYNDSRHSGRFNFPKEKNTDQRTKETFRQESLAESIPLQKQLKEKALRNTAYFQAPQTFRIKHHVSCSPNKKHSEKAINPSLTLFGHKFKTTKEKLVPIQEIMTFYGKSPRGEISGRDSKCYSKPSGHLELDELIEAQKKIKTNFSQKIFLKQLRVEGLKGKLAQRKNKFC